MGMEIERKWLPESLPDFIADRLDEYESIHMIQAYLCRKPVIRIRKENEDYVLTYKGEGYKVREEYNLPLNKEAFEELLPKCSGRVIEKTRYVIPLQEGLKAEFDIFGAELEGLCLLEVEFDSEEAADVFIAEKWFGKEVTGCEKYTNSYLSSANSVV